MFCRRIELSDSRPNFFTQRRLPHLLSIGGGDRNIAVRAELLRHELSVGSLQDIPKAVAKDGDIGSTVAVVIGGRGNISWQSELKCRKALAASK